MEPNPTPEPTGHRKKRGRPTNASLSENLTTLGDFTLHPTVPRTVGFGVTGPAPPGTRFPVNRFADVAKHLGDLVEQRLAQAPPEIHDIDLDVSDLRYKSPDMAVAEAIAAVAARPDFLEINGEQIAKEVEVPNFEELQQKETESTLAAMEHIKFVRAAIPKVRSKYVNYLARAIEEETIPVSPISGTELIISIAFYPAQSTSVVQEFLVLSTQKLTELKDMLYCVQDQSPTGEASSSIPNGAPPSYNGENGASRNRGASMDLDIPEEAPKPAPGYFFFDNTFYSDMRGGHHVNYADSTVNWINRGASAYWSSQSPVHEAKMEETTFGDLTVQIGKKYLYCHRGHCEHVITITDIRTIIEGDDQNLNAYPKQIYQAKYRQRRCTICDRTVAKWITSGDTFSVEDPSYYCQECFDMAHTNEDGSLRNTGFKILPYLHD